MDVWDHVLSSRGVAWISSDKDAAALGWADGESTDAMFFLQLLEFSVLLSPLRTTLTLGTLVWLWEELFDGDDGY